MATVSQLSNDPALETSLFWDQYKKPIIALIVLLVLGGLGFAAYEFQQQKGAAEASALLAGAKTPADLQGVIDRYPESGAAASAYLLLGAQQRESKSYQESNGTLHKFIDHFPKHELITTAWMGVAGNLQSLGKNDEALNTYHKVATDYPQSFNAPLALLAEVPMLKTAGRNEEARRACETIISQYRDSVLMTEAIRQLQSLPKATTPPAGSPSPQATPSK